MELHTECRRDLHPDPEIDAIQAIFFSILNDIPSQSGKRELSGVVMVDVMSASLSSTRNMANSKPKTKQQASMDQPPGEGTFAVPNKGSISHHTLLEKTGLSNVNVTYAKDERHLLELFVHLVRE